MDRSLDLLAWRQFVDGDRRLSHRPQITPLFAEGVFEQQSVVIERLLLNLRKGEGAGTRERGVTRTGGANLRLNSLVFHLERFYLSSGRGGLFLSMLTA